MPILILLFMLLMPVYFSVGMDVRVAQENFYQMAILTLLTCSVLANNKAVKFNKVNLWVGVFGLWAMVTYAMTKGKMGSGMLLNIIFGILLYFTCLKTLKKEDAPLIFKGIL